VSCGLDDGKFYLFDARDKITSTAFYIDTRTEDLFTHERYNDFMVLLGYGSGEIKHIDMRQARTVSVTDLVSFDAPVHFDSFEPLTLRCRHPVVIVVQSVRRAGSIRGGDRWHRVQCRVRGIRGIGIH